MQINRGEKEGEVEMVLDQFKASPTVNPKLVLVQPLIVFQLLKKATKTESFQIPKSLSTNIASILGTHNLSGLSPPSLHL